MIASIELNDTLGIYEPFFQNQSSIGGALYDSDDEQMADYVVSRTINPEDNSKAALQFDFVFMEWNEETEQDEGAVVSLVFRKTEAGFGFQLIDGNESLLPAEGVAKSYTVADIKEWVPMQQLVQSASQFILNNDDRIPELLKSE